MSKREFSEDGKLIDAVRHMRELPQADRDRLIAASPDKVLDLRPRLQGEVAANGWGRGEER